MLAGLVTVVSSVGTVVNAAKSVYEQVKPAIDTRSCN
jgi:hypothetical protein